MEEHFHVHGAHDHQVEHEAQSGAGLAQYIAIFTAVLATLGAIVSYLGGHTQNEALYYKNDAVLKKAEASDQWNFYQAKSNKGHLTELAMLIAPPEKQEFYKNEGARYEREKKEIRAKAEQFEAQSKQADEMSVHALHPHNRLAQSMTLIQIAIALASITVLTRKRWLLVFAGAGAAGGLILAALAYIT
jgi:Domain of unknown function (DUF4337)